MELISYRGRMVARMTLHHDHKTNVVKAVVIKFDEGDQLMFAVDGRRRNDKLDISFAPAGVELMWSPN